MHLQQCLSLFEVFALITDQQEVLHSDISSQPPNPKFYFCVLDKTNIVVPSSDLT